MRSPASHATDVTWRRDVYTADAGSPYRCDCRRTAPRQFGGPLVRDRHLPWCTRVDAVPERRRRPSRRQHRVRLGAVPGRATAAVRPRHRSALLRRVDHLRRALRGHVPAQPPALGPRSGPAVLQAAAAPRRPTGDPRPRPVRRPPSRRGAAQHDPSAVVPDLARRVQRRRHDPLRQAAVLRRLVHRCTRGSCRTTGRWPATASSATTAASRTSATTSNPTTRRDRRVRARAVPRRRPADPRRAVHAERVRTEAHVGPLHRRVRGVGRHRRQASSAWPCSTTTRTTTTTRSSGSTTVAQRCAVRTASRSLPPPRA